MIDVKWKIERDGEDAIITVIANGQETVQRETGKKAAAMCEAVESKKKLGIWSAVPAASVPAAEAATDDRRR